MNTNIVGPKDGKLNDGCVIMCPKSLNSTSPLMYAHLDLLPKGRCSVQK